MRAIPKIILPNEEEQKIERDREMLGTFVNVDFQRTRFWCLCANVAIDYPRRLPDATPRELSYDKRVSRKVCHSYHILWELFRKTTAIPPPPIWADKSVVNFDPLMNRIGATVIWERQIAYSIDVVLLRMTKLTDLEDTAYHDGLKAWYNKHAELLNWELEALHRVQGFLQTKRPTQ